MKNKKIFLIIISSLLCIISIIYLIQSFSFYDDGYGYDISFDSDIIVLLICSVTLLIYSLNYKDNNIALYYGCFGIISVLLSFYPIGMFIKNLIKEKPFIEIQDYLYIGIIGIVMLIYIIKSYLNKKSQMS